MSTPIDRHLSPESLCGALDRLYALLTRTPQTPTAHAPEAGSPGQFDEPWHTLERLQTIFGLSSFERDVLALCTAPNIQSRFITGFGEALNDIRATSPTFGLALAVLDDPHWSALSPDRPLRYWQLVDIDGGDLLHAKLRVDERVLLFLIGVTVFDERLRALIHPIAGPPDDAGGLRQPHVIEVGTHYWTENTGGHEPLLFIGAQRSDREGAFATICQRTGLWPYRLDAEDIPTGAFEREQLARLWSREAALMGAGLYMRTQDCDDVQKISAWLELVDAPVVIEVQPGTAAEQLDGLRLHLVGLSAEERKELWACNLGPLAHRMNGSLDRIAEYFHFDEPAIRRSAGAIREAAATGDGSDPGELSWRICREYARRSLEAHARRIDARADWNDLVLPAQQVEILRQIAIHVRQRAVVNEQWGFATKHPRGLGLTVLFAGSSGTGKTMAAEILATELDLDLYRVDLASVVSKYIGETEKNLRAIFNGAELSGAILLFDEADALFGKRSEVHDSHDRYANLEISYLLQQMEAYRGIAILTTNMQHALDPAFMRRIRFIVQFPFPDAGARESIWRRIFPTTTPLGDLDFDQLAQLNVAGGVIRNIAMHAAFLAADDVQVVEPQHILAAAKTEYAKINKPLTAAETRGLT